MIAARKMDLLKVPKAIILSLSLINPSYYVANAQECAYFIDSVDISSDFQVGLEAEPLCNTFSMEGEYIGVDLEKRNIGPLKCCSYDARRDVLNGRGGGFRVEYVEPIERGYYAPSEEAALCYAHVDALGDTLCSPNQASYVSENLTFRVCEQACDAVYNACVPTNVIMSHPDVIDGKSLCETAWAGGFYSNNPCEMYPNGFPCVANLTLEVVSASGPLATIGSGTGIRAPSCATIPSEYNTTSYYEFSNEFNRCQAEVTAWTAGVLSVGAIIGIAIAAAACLFLCCVAFFCIGGAGAIFGLTQHNRKKKNAQKQKDQVPVVNLDEQQKADYNNKANKESNDDDAATTDTNNENVAPAATAPVDTSAAAAETVPVVTH